MFSRTEGWKMAHMYMRFLVASLVFSFAAVSTANSQESAEKIMPKNITHQWLNINEPFDIWLNIDGIPIVWLNIKHEAI